MNHFTPILSLACIASLLAIGETYRDYSSPYVDPCGASATQAHDGDIAYNPIPSSSSRQKRGATAIRERLWPNARIPYKISPTFDSYEQSLLYEAMRQWEARTCVRFYERPSTHNQSYAYYFKGGCCASYVGRQSVSYQQGISLGSGCTTISKYLHEIGHVIGFWHEQSRPDRDEYIRILTENMNPGTQSNFRIQEEIDSMGVGYDYNSIMHYSSTTFGSGRTTLVAHDSSIPVGGAVELSELDILQANLLYQCDSENPPPSELPPPVASDLEQTLPDLPDCHMDFNNDYEGVVKSDNYPSTYSPNQNCAYRIRVPEGTKTECDHC
ncbi:Bone morphogenetic protein 1 homolog [Geodia barretti]|uniref:Metalloendopeptidase n=1 Tax=Geodia barretti TaxID=519541 RepID=A0AA35RZI4_GEOBA|nr:Bone morphogenetic protein 1 homolog [Geodia barretti]